MSCQLSKIVSRLAHLSSPSLLALALLAAPAPAEAVVAASSGNWTFSLYKDTGCEGSHVDAVFSSGLKTVAEPDLRDVSFNDVASSWSFCNSTTKTAAVGIHLYTDVNYGGTELTWSITVPSGNCITKNSLTSDNAVSSFKVYVITY